MSDNNLAPRRPGMPGSPPFQQPGMPGSPPFEQHRPGMPGPHERRPRVDLRNSHQPFLFQGPNDNADVNANDAVRPSLFRTGA